MYYISTAYDVESYYVSGFLYDTEQINGDYADTGFRICIKE